MTQETMTVDQFLDRLKQVAADYEWKTIVHSDTYYPVIRATKKGSGESHRRRESYCPINAVAGKPWAAHADNQAKAIGLSVADTEKIMWAADSEDLPSAELRDKILIAVGLKA